MATQKFSILKSETFESIVEKMKNALGTDIVIRVPKGSTLGGNGKNLRALAKEAKSAGKRLMIESVDDTVVEFAKQAGIEAFNPFFLKTNQFSDIVTQQSSVRPMREVVSSLSQKNHSYNASAQSIGGGVSQNNKSQSNIVSSVVRNTERVESDKSETHEEMEHYGGEVRAGRRAPTRLITFVVGALVIIFGAVFVGNVFARTTVVVVREKFPWNYAGTITVDPQINVVASSGARIPGESFTLKNTFEEKFLASGTRDANDKARGVITIFNNFSTAPQFLIRNTRFESPDGKIFRLIDDVTVPGATMVSGSLRASSIDAPVIADQPGESYNIPPVSKFTIPGFSGSARFTGFYGSSRTPMTGGYVGFVTYPTTEELAKAEAEFAKKAEDALLERVARQIPKDLIFPAGARSFRFISKTTDSIAGPDKRFTIRGEAELRVVAFRESDVKEFLSRLGAQSVGGGKTLLSSEISYGVGQISSGTSSILSLPITAISVFATSIDVQALKESIAGRRLKDISVMKISGAESELEVSARPFWMRRAPKDFGKILIELK